MRLLPEVEVVAGASEAKGGPVARQAESARRLQYCGGGRRASKGPPSAGAHRRGARPAVAMFP
eukprot:747335-Lingulodinium_polyedra.AAC.1